MKKVFLFSLVVLLSCKINATGLNVAHSNSYWAEHERQVTAPVRVDSSAVAFTDTQDKSCIQANSTYATISTSWNKAYNNYMNSNYYSAGCSPYMGYPITADGVDCQAVAGQAISIANKAAPAYFTANPLSNYSLCPGGVCGPKGCAPVQYATADSVAIPAEPLL